MNAPPQPARHRGRALAILFVAALVLNGLAAALMPQRFRPAEETDYVQWYAPVADSIVAGRGLADPEGGPAMRYPPGYPLILAAVYHVADAVTFDRDQAVIAFNALAMAFSVVLLYLLAETLAGGRAALLAAVLWITYPLGLYFAQRQLSGVPFTPLLLAGLLAAAGSLRDKAIFGFVVAAVAFAAAALIRPIGLLLPIFIALLLPAARSMPLGRRLAAAGMLLAFYVAGLAPWTMIASRAAGRFVPLSTGGATTMVDGLAYAYGDPSRKDIPVAPDVAAIGNEAMARKSRLDTPGAVLHFVGEKFAENPAAVCKLYAIKVGRSWYATNSRQHDRLILLAQLPYLAAALAGLAVAVWRRQWRLVAICAGTVLYFWAMTTAFMSIIRYMLPAMSLVMVLAAVLIDRILPRRRVPHSNIL